MKTTTDYRRPMPGCAPVLIPAGTPLEPTGRPTFDAWRVSRDHPAHPFRLASGALLGDLEFHNHELPKMGLA